MREPKNSQGYTTAEVAEVLGCCVKTVQRKIRSGKWKAHKGYVGNTWYFSKDEINQILSNDRTNIK